VQRLNNGLCQNKRFVLDKTPNRRSFNRTQLHHAVSTQTCFIGSFKQNTPGYRQFYIATANFQQICLKELKADLNRDSISCDLKSHCFRMILRYKPSSGVCVNKWCRRSIRWTFGWVFTGTNLHVRFVRRQLYRSTTSAQTSTSTISAGNVECVTMWLKTWIGRTITSRQPIDGTGGPPDGLPTRGEKNPFVFIQKKQLYFGFVLNKTGF